MTQGDSRGPWFLLYALGWAISSYCQRTSGANIPFEDFGLPEYFGNNPQDSNSLECRLRATAQE